MNEFLTIPELKEELRKIWQAYENEEITVLQFGAATTDLYQRIKDRELTLAKQAAFRELGNFGENKNLTLPEWAHAITAIANAKTEAEVNAIKLKI